MLLEQSYSLWLSFPTYVFLCCEQPHARTFSLHNHLIATGSHALHFLHSPNTSKNSCLEVVDTTHVTLRTHLSVHRSAPYPNASACQYVQYTRPETYALNMLICCTEPIQLLLVHQSMYYLVRAQCGQLVCHFCYLDGSDGNIEEFFVLIFINIVFYIGCWFLSHRYKLLT